MDLVGKGATSVALAGVMSRGTRLRLRGRRKGVGGNAGARTAVGREADYPQMTMDCSGAQVHVRPETDRRSVEGTRMLRFLSEGKEEKHPCVSKGSRARKRPTAKQNRFSPSRSLHKSLHSAENVTGAR